ncbi:hypothetical protein PsorP6_012489 [Peronosclerospora sorghi]|uniref:Uncharacterized protein n=1 Tax=Peronosclerospora sorghi TaxID=230839 RepID=A0ACC0WH27_9STRA|nr:hypothetical protein PsorP6_012489 [Peronosclerospora sorghi]
MVKQKNHTARNNTVKAHRNGIKKPKNHRFHSTRGLDPKFLRNQHWAKKYDKKHRNRKYKDKVWITSSLDGVVSLSHLQCFMVQEE